MLVAGKLRMPPAPARLVARPRVEGLIAGMIERQAVVFVTATAGAGKTTAVCRATALVDRPPAWVTAGNGDAAAGRLIEYLAVAISAHVPSAGGLATAAIADGIAPEAVAALMVQAVGDQRLLLVLDEVDRVSGSPSAIAVLDALARGAPPGMRLVLISRRDLPLDTPELRRTGRAGLVDERDLAFNLQETADALRLVGAEGIDASGALELTGGWVTGVMFEAWQASEQHSENGAVPDPLRDYFSRNILDELTSDERELLLVTSVITAVTARDAQALGLADAALRLAALRSRHLPASWRSDPLTMRCHPRFREFLRDQFRREAATVQGPREVTQR
jgi:ATP/maltotriose-dependent transcriptional regulator MalT